MAKSSAVISPNLGLYLDRPAIAMSPRMLADGYNFRVKEGKLNNFSLGWTRLGDFTLNGPVVLITNFLMRSGTEHLILGTLKDLYLFDGSTETVEFLTPRYETGTASAAGTAVTGTGTTWSTNAKAGDYIHFGASGQTDPDATWFEIDSVGGDTSITLTTSAGTVANGAYTIRKTFTGDLQDIWVFDTFLNASPSTEDEWWATNGVDDIIRWNGTDDQVEIMSSLGFKCKSLRVYKNMMTFFDLDQGGTRKPTDMINSDVGSPENVSTGLSEQFKVMDGPNPIVNAKLLGDSLAIYSKDRVTIAQFVGDPVVFIFRTASTVNGAVAARAISDFGNYHEFIGTDSQYIFDGVTVKETNSHVWRDIIRQQDPVRIGFTYSHFDDENGDLLWVVPLTTDPSSGDATAAPVSSYVEHYLEAKSQEDTPTPFSVRSFPFTASGYFFRQEGLTWAELTQTWSSLTFRWNDKFFFTSFPLSIVGDANGKVYTLNTSQNGDGTALNSFVEFGRRATVDGLMRGLITRVYPFASQLTNILSVSVKLADHANGPYSITDTQTFDQNLTQGAHFTTHYRRGRFFTVRFATNAVDAPWELAGYDVGMRGGGFR